MTNHQQQVLATARQITNKFRRQVILAQVIDLGEGYQLRLFADLNPQRDVYQCGFHHYDNKTLVRKFATQTDFCRWIVRWIEGFLCIASDHDLDRIDEVLDGIRGGAA